MKKLLIVHSIAAISVFIVAIFSISIITKNTTLTEFSSFADILLFLSVMGIFDLTRLPIINMVNNKQYLDNSKVVGVAIWSGIILVVINSILFFTSYLLLDMKLIDFSIYWLSAIFLIFNGIFLGLTESIGEVLWNGVARALSWIVFYLLSVINILFYDKLTLYPLLIYSVLALLLSSGRFMQKNRYGMSYKFDSSYFKNFYSMGLSVVIHYFFSLLYANYERLIARFLMTETIYAVVSAFGELANKFSFISRVIGQSSYRFLLRKRVEDYKYYVALMTLIDIFYFVLILTSALIIFYYSENIVKLYFGQEYLQYINYFEIILFMGVLKVLSYSGVMRLNHVDNFTLQYKILITYLPVMLICTVLIYYQIIGLEIAILLTKLSDILTYLYSNYYVSCKNESK